MNFLETLLKEYWQDMQAAEPLQRKPITQGYARILELREAKKEK